MCLNEIFQFFFPFSLTLSLGKWIIYLFHFQFYFLFSFSIHSLNLHHHVDECEADRWHGNDRAEMLEYAKVQCIQRHSLQCLFATQHVRVRISLCFYSNRWLDVKCCETCEMRVWVAGWCEFEYIRKLKMVPSLKDKRESSGCVWSIFIDWFTILPQNWEQTFETTYCQQQNGRFSVYYFFLFYSQFPVRHSRSFRALMCSLIKFISIIVKQ